MSRVFPGGNDAIVTVEAVTNDICMIKYGTKPGKCPMAVIAYITALNMPHIFTRRGYTVMATLTTPQYRKMIDLEDVSPPPRLVTEITILSGRNMLW